MTAAKKRTTPKRTATKSAAKRVPKKPIAKKPIAKKPIAKKPIAKKPVAKKLAAKQKSDLDTVSWWDDFYRVVRRIPAGRVSTYGTVAAFAGHPRAARHVGYAMAALKDTRKNRDVPWQRVLGAAPRNRARVTIKDPIGGAMQRALLEAEGVNFDAQGRVSLDVFGWSGPRRR